MRKGKVGIKGFIISFDSLVAVLLLFAMIIAATGYLANVEFEAASSISLKETAMDSLTALDKSGKLGKAASASEADELRAFLNRLPYSICADLRLYRESDLENPMLLVLRPDCKKNFKELATVKRSIVVESGGNAGFYLAELRAWYRVG